MQPDKPANARFRTIMLVMLAVVAAVIVALRYANG